MPFLTILMNKDMEIDFSKYKDDIKLIREVMDEHQMDAMFRMMQVLFMESFFGFVPPDLDPEEQKKKVAVPKEFKTSEIDDIELTSLKIEKTEKQNSEIQLKENINERFEALLEQMKNIK